VKASAPGLVKFYTHVKSTHFPQEVDENHLRNVSLFDSEDSFLETVARNGGCSVEEMYFVPRDVKKGGDGWGGIASQQVINTVTTLSILGVSGWLAYAIFAVRKGK